MLCPCQPRAQLVARAGALLFARGCAAALIATTALGCDDTSARLFSVTVQEPLTIQCEGVTYDENAYDEDTIKGFAIQTRRAWKREKERFPPLLRGRELHIIEVESSVRVWFEAGEANSDFTTGFGAVFDGTLEEDFVQANYEQVLNTDEDDEDAGWELCGPRPLLAGEFSATDVNDSILGRIRWQDIQYYSSESSSCAATVTCTRDVSVWGAEQ